MFFKIPEKFIQEMTTGQGLLLVLNSEHIITIEAGKKNEEYFISIDMLSDRSIDFNIKNYEYFKEIIELLERATCETTIVNNTKFEEFDK